MNTCTAKTPGIGLHLSVALLAGSCLYPLCSTKMKYLACAALASRCVRCLTISDLVEILGLVGPDSGIGILLQDHDSPAHYSVLAYIPLPQFSASAFIVMGR